MTHKIYHRSSSRTERLARRRPPRVQERVHRKSPLSLAKFLRLIVVGAVLSVAAFIATAFATLALVRRSCRT